VQIAGPDPNRQPVENAAIPERARAGYAQSDDPAVLERWRSQHVGLPDDVRDQLRRDIDNNPPERRRGQGAPWPGLEDVAPNLAIPTMVVLGDADDVVNPAQPLEYYLTLPPEVRHLHVFHGIGHYPPAHVPSRLAGVMKRFIDEQVAAG
jgi:pimeloyl-ACP methyl ester carboxylesterase